MASLPPHLQFQQQQQKGMIQEPTDRDVLCGVDPAYAKHAGNVLYRAIITARSGQFAAAPTWQIKRRITKAVLEDMKKVQHARFLLLCQDGMWIEIPDEQVFDMTLNFLHIQMKHSPVQQQQQQQQQQHQPQPQEFLPALPKLPLLPPLLPDRNRPHPRPMLPAAAIICDPTFHDVLCGIGSTHDEHPGNAVYRAIIAAQAQYATVHTHYDRKKITEAIVQLMKIIQKARFLQLWQHDTWSEITDQQALDMTSHMLRCFHTQEQPTQKLRSHKRRLLQTTANVPPKHATTQNQNRILIPEGDVIGTSVSRLVTVFLPRTADPFNPLAFPVYRYTIQVEKPWDAGEIHLCQIAQQNHTALSLVGVGIRVVGVGIRGQTLGLRNDDIPFLHTPPLHEGGQLFLESLKDDAQRDELLQKMRTHKFTLYIARAVPLFEGQLLAARLSSSETTGQPLETYLFETVQVPFGHSPPFGVVESGRDTVAVNDKNSNHQLRSSDSSDTKSPRTASEQPHPRDAVTLPPGALDTSIVSPAPSDRDNVGVTCGSPPVVPNPARQHGKIPRPDNNTTRLDAAPTKRSASLEETHQSLPKKRQKTIFDYDFAAMIR